MKNYKYISLCFAVLSVFIPSCFKEARFEPLKADSLNLEKSIDLYEYAQELFGKSVIDIKSLPSLDDSEDFLCALFDSGGYAIFYRESLELLEYSPNSNIKELYEKDKLYYTGPKGFFKKTGSYLTNVLDKTKAKNNTSEIKKESERIRTTFSKTSGKKIQIADTQTRNIASGEANHPIDTTNPIKITSGKKIRDYTYFTISPYHGTNDNNTCGAVAAEMMLTFHNYYSDRRIIPNNYLNGNSTSKKEDNPNYCTDPIRMTPETLGAKGDSDKDVNNPNNYFAKIAKKIPSNASYSTVTSGIKSILNERNNELTNKIVFNVEEKLGNWFGSQPVNTKRVRDQIDDGNPSIILMQKRFGAINHYVVAYGYEDYTYPGTDDTYSGFITNFGWGHEDINIWVNASWICAYTTMTITHDHNYSVVGKISGTERDEFKCNICGHRTDAVIIESNANSKRCNEKIMNLPLNRDLYVKYYGTGNPDEIYNNDYIQKRDYVKRYYYKPASHGNRLVQTFSNKSTEIAIVDSDKKTILLSSSSGGYFNNAFLNYNFEMNKVYYIQIKLFPLRDIGDVKLVIVPTEQTYFNYNSIELISGENVTTNISLNKKYVKVLLFNPSIYGKYNIMINGSIDTVLYFSNPLKGDEKALFDDDSAGNYQPSLFTNNISPSTKYFIIVSAYSLASNSTTLTINLTITKTSA